MTHPEYSSGTAIAWQFRQRSALGQGPQSQAPWGEWCSIEREIYEMYVEAPNKLVEVRALTVLDDAQPSAGIQEPDRTSVLARLTNSLIEWQERHQYDVDTAAEIILGDLERAGLNGVAQASLPRALTAENGVSMKQFPPDGHPYFKPPYAPEERGSDVSRFLLRIACIVGTCVGGWGLFYLAVAFVLALMWHR